MPASARATTCSATASAYAPAADVHRRWRSTLPEPIQPSIPADASWTSGCRGAAPPRSRGRCPRPTRRSPRQPPACPRRRLHRRSRPPRGPGGDPGRPRRRELPRGAILARRARTAHTRGPRFEERDHRHARARTDASRRRLQRGGGSYDHPANAFWDRYGRRTVDRLRLPVGARVLDVCCGSGASAIPAAEAVGTGGFVLGVDLAEGLLELARAKARERDLANVEFRAGDMLDTRPARGGLRRRGLRVRHLLRAGHGGGRP